MGRRLLVERIWFIAPKENCYVSTDTLSLNSFAIAMKLETEEFSDQFKGLLRLPGIHLASEHCGLFWKRKNQMSCMSIILFLSFLPRFFMQQKGFI
jgi:hypothetical protein